MLAGRVVPHDDSVNDRSEGSQLTTCSADTRKAWMGLYGTPWARPGGMWCGDPPPWYFEQRDIAADLLGSVLAIAPSAANAAEHEVAASAMAAGLRRTIRTGSAALVAAPTPLISMTVSGRSMGAPATTAITIPDWGHFAPVPAFTSYADRPESVEAPFGPDKV